LLLKTEALVDAVSSFASFPQNTLFTTVGLLPSKLYIPPPLLVAELPEKETLLNVGLLLKLLYIPPPLLVAEVPVKGAVL